MKRHSSSILHRDFTDKLPMMYSLNSQLWSPNKLADIDSLEIVQRYVTKRLPDLWETPYEQRLRIIGLLTLEHRRIMLDLYLCYNIMHSLECIKASDYFNRVISRSTRSF